MNDDAVELLMLKPKQVSGWWPLPDVPFAILPGVLQDNVGPQAEVIGVDPSAMAMATLTTVSGALDHRFAVKMMMRNGNWWEHPRLWTLLCSDPSSRKTPCINAATDPLELHQADFKRDYDTRLRDYTQAKKAKQKVEAPDPPDRFKPLILFDRLSKRRAFRFQTHQAVSRKSQNDFRACGAAQ
jgi:hypothetical protein